MRLIILFLSMLMAGCQPSNVDELWAQLEKCEELFSEPCYLMAAPDSAEKDIRELYSKMLTQTAE